MTEPAWRVGLAEGFVGDAPLMNHLAEVERETATQGSLFAVVSP